MITAPPHPTAVELNPCCCHDSADSNLGKHPAPTQRRRGYFLLFQFQNFFSIGSVRVQISSILFTKATSILKNDGWKLNLSENMSRCLVLDDRYRTNRGNATWRSHCKLMQKQPHRLWVLMKNSIIFKHWQFLYLSIEIFVDCHCKLLK